MAIDVFADDQQVHFCCHSFVSYFVSLQFFCLWMAAETTDDWPFIMIFVRPFRHTCDRYLATGSSTISFIFFFLLFSVEIEIVCRIKIFFAWVAIIIEKLKHCFYLICFIPNRSQRRKSTGWCIRRWTTFAWFDAPKNRRIGTFRCPALWYITYLTSIKRLREQNSWPILWDGQHPATCDRRFKTTSGYHRSCQQNITVQKGMSEHICMGDSGSTATGWRLLQR